MSRKMFHGQHQRYEKKLALIKSIERKRSKITYHFSDLAWKLKDQKSIYVKSWCLLTEESGVEDNMKKHQEEIDRFEKSESADIQQQTTVQHMIHRFAS